jgi:hypothetical protein
MARWVLTLALAAALTNFSGFVLFSGIFFTALVLIGCRIWNDPAMPGKSGTQSLAGGPAAPQASDLPR